MLEIDVSRFTCIKCNEGCKCLFICGNKEFCANIEIYFEEINGNLTKKAKVIIFEYRNKILGKELNNNIIDVIDDIILIPTAYFECLNLQQDCNCK